MPGIGVEPEIDFLNLEGLGETFFKVGDRLDNQKKRLAW
jgi:hypothetical protein